MTRTWTIRPSTPDDLPDLRDLFTTVFGAERPLAHVQWKFARGPSGPGIGMVAVDAGRIVGQYVLLSTALRLGRDVVAGAQSLDTMVHPDYRGQGMFVKLAEACYALAAERGIEMLYGFPNENSYPGFMSRLGWSHVADVPRWVRHIDLSRHPRVPRIVRPLARLAGRVMRAGDPQKGGITVKPGRPDAASLEQLLTQWRSRTDLCRVERSAAWYDWRFSPDSGERYTWLTAWRAAEARGSLVLNLPASTIADFLGDDADALEALVATAIRQAAPAGCASLSTSTSEPAPAAALAACGFRPRMSAPLIVRALGRRQHGAECDAGTWSINPADFDTF